MPKKTVRAHTLKPQDLTEDAWFYDGKNGLDLTIWVTTRVSKGGRQAENITIPWRKVAAALKRHNNYIWGPDMSNISAALLLIRKIAGQAEDGQNGSASYAMDRLRHIQTLAGIAKRKLEAESK